MERNCNNCLYADISENEEPCCRCRGTVMDGSPAYNTRPDLWTAEECDSKPETVSDSVNHPSHYNNGKFECIDVMQEVFGAEAVKDFCLCNAFKYLYRTNRKNGLEDIKKCHWYVTKYLEIVENEESKY